MYNEINVCFMKSKLNRREHDDFYYLTNAPPMIGRANDYVIYENPRFKVITKATTFLL